MSEIAGLSAVVFYASIGGGVLLLLGCACYCCSVQENISCAAFFENVFCCGCCGNDRQHYDEEYDGGPGGYQPGRLVRERVVERGGGRSAGDAGAFAILLQMLVDKVGRVEERLDQSEQQLEEAREERGALQQQQQPREHERPAEMPSLDRLSGGAPGAAQGPPPGAPGASGVRSYI